MRPFACLRPLRLLLIFIATWSLLLQPARAKETPLPAAVNLQLEASAAGRQGMPLVLIVSLPDCPYCEQVRRQHLVPMHKQGFVVRQVYINSESSVTGFNGKPISQKQLAIDYGVKAAPTVLFLDERGRSLAAPIVGALLEDFYGAYLDEAIETAKQKLAR